MEERPVEQGQQGKICRTICAFANDIANTRAPGYIVLGIGKDGARQAWQSPIS